MTGLGFQAWYASMGTAVVVMFVLAGAATWDPRRGLWDEMAPRLDDHLNAPKLTLIVFCVFMFWPLALVAALIAVVFDRR